MAKAFFSSLLDIKCARAAIRVGWAGASVVQKAPRGGERQDTFFWSAQMQDEQVGDALVLGEWQTQGWRFGLTASVGVAVHTVDKAVDAIDVPVYSVDLAIHSVRDVSCIWSGENESVC